MVKKSIKTVEDIHQLMEEKRQKADKKRLDQMKDGDVEPNGISAAEALNGHSDNDKSLNTSIGDMNGFNGSANGESSTSQKKKRKNKKKKKNRRSSNAGFDGTSSNDVTSEGKEPKKTSEEQVENPRKRKAAQRAEASLAVLPVSRRKDDSDSDDQDYCVESPDEDGNPKRLKIADDEDDWSRQTLEQRIANMLAGGTFYDGSSEEDSPFDDGENGEENETEVEYSDSDDVAGRIDIDGSSDDGDDIFAEDSDGAEDLVDFIAAGDGSSDEEAEDDEDVDLGDEEYTDISPMFHVTTDYKFKIDGYRTVKENGVVLKLERATASKARGGAFTTFKFGQIADTHSVQVAMDAFDWMVSPIERDAFFNHLFQRRAVYVHRRDKNYYKGLFSSDGLLRMVQENDLEYGTNINIAHYDREGGRSTHNPVGRVFAHQLKTFVNAGMSVQCINPQSYNDEIWYLCEILQELTNSFVGANTYLTPANSAGFAPHWDEVDAFILQVEGKKYWRVWAPADGNAALPDESSRNFTEKEMADKTVVFEGHLEEGDLLYVPRGFYHSASTGKEHSLHVTVSLCHNVTFTHLMKNISDDVWDSVRQTRLLSRRSLPPGFLEMGGVAALDYEEGLNEHIMPVVNSMLEDIAEAYRTGMPAAIDKMAQQFYKSALPPILTLEERQHSIHGGENLSMFDDSEVKVTRKKEIRFIRKHAQRLLYENEETPFIIHRMSNSRILSENKEQNVVSIDLKMVDGINNLFNEYPQWIKVKDLGCGKHVNVQLAEILYNNGLVMIRDKLL